MDRKIKRLILHIGTGKTGTSSIQNTLGENRKELLKHNIHYPGIKPYNHIFTFPPIFWDDPSKHYLVKRKSLSSPEEVRSFCDNLMNRWTEEFSACSCDNFIISAEDLSLINFNSNAILRMKEYLNQYFEKITVVVYIRHYKTLIPSVIQQIIKNGNFANDFKKIIKRLTGEESQILYSRKIGPWFDSFGTGNIIVRPFDKTQFTNGCLIDDFLDSLGFPFEDIQLNKIIKNESLGYNSITFLEKFNQKYPRMKNRELNTERAMARSGIPLNLFSSIEDKKFSLPIHYDDKSLALLNKEIDYVNSLFPDDYQFKPLVNEHPETIIPDFKDIPPDFFIELINNYNKHISEFGILSAEAASGSLPTEKSLRKKHVNALLEAYLFKSKSLYVMLMNIFHYLYFSIFGLRGFDPEYYLRTYEYVRTSGRNPLFHFIFRGVYLGMKPNRDFRTIGFILNNPQIVTNGKNALVEHNRKARKSGEL